MDLFSAALLLVFTGVYTFAYLTGSGHVAEVDWWHVGLMVVLTVLHVVKYTSATFRRWLDDPAVLGGVAFVSLGLAVGLFTVHGTTPAWPFALFGVVAGVGTLWEYADPRPLRADPYVRVAVLAVAVACVAFGASFLAGPLDRSSTAAATLSTAAGIMFAWLALRSQGFIAWPK